MGDWRKQGHAIRRREGAPSSHLDGSRISTQRENNTLVATSGAGTSVMALSTSPGAMAVPNNPDLEDTASQHRAAASGHASIYGLGSLTPTTMLDPQGGFNHRAVKDSPDAAIYPDDQQ